MKMSNITRSSTSLCMGGVKKRRISLGNAEAMCLCRAGPILRVWFGRPLTMPIGESSQTAPPRSTNPKRRGDDFPLLLGLISPFLLLARRPPRAPFQSPRSRGRLPHRFVVPWCGRRGQVVLRARRDEAGAEGGREARPAQCRVPRAEAPRPGPPPQLHRGRRAHRLADS